LPGKILQEVVQNDRVVGGINDASTRAACAFLSLYVKGQLIPCSSRMAEMAKLTENASRDVQIAFANELSMVCHELGLDVRELIAIANRHPRVNILQPGCGVGGHCIAVDPWFIVHLAQDAQGQSLARLMQTAREVNDHKPHWVVARVEEAIATCGVALPRVACFGATYKQDIDDLRESPALEICQKLTAQYPNQVMVVEPNVSAIPGLDLVTIDQAMAADVWVFLVNHRVFSGINRDVVAKKVCVDASGLGAQLSR
jgi:UDP-N-acetyl-D-mannosaminuronic acid dehydrogenase